MRPVNFNNHFAYKKSRRQRIYEHGFNIIMSVGDMPFDFGDYGGKSVRIKL